MTALRDRLAALIASQGPMSVAEYMTLALREYYSTRDPLGAKGDFLTAPETSQIFGELIGLWLAQVWHDQGQPERPVLVELGPGRGSLMDDALRAIRLVPELYKALDVVLVENSPTLRGIQQETLKDIEVPVRWTDSFDGVPNDRPLLLIANEFFDALPIRQFVKTERGWCERVVTCNDAGSLAFAVAPVAIAAPPVNRAAAPLGGFYERSPIGEALAEEVSVRIGRHGGAALIIDYGYGTDAGFAETLQAVKGHKHVGVLDDPGESDLSAHVDFAALTDRAHHDGGSAFGPVSQGAFLKQLGIRERAEKLSTSSDAKASVVERQVARLINDDQMGQLFKALAIVPASAPKPPGF